MSDDGVAAATCAVVVDAVADLIEADGPGKAVRLLMRQEDALALWRKLGELFGCDTDMRPAAAVSARNAVVDRNRELDTASCEEVAAALFTTKAALSMLRYRGLGPAYSKAGRRVIYRWADVQAYLDKNQQHSPPCGDRAAIRPPVADDTPTS